MFLEILRKVPRPVADCGGSNFAHYGSCIPKHCDPECIDFRDGIPRGLGRWTRGYDWRPTECPSGYITSRVPHPSPQLRRPSHHRIKHLILTSSSTMSGYDFTAADLPRLSPSSSLSDESRLTPDIQNPLDMHQNTTEPLVDADDFAHPLLTGTPDFFPWYDDELTPSSSCIEPKAIGPSSADDSDAWLTYPYFADTGSFDYLGTGLPSTFPSQRNYALETSILASMDLPAAPLSPEWGWLPLTRTSRPIDVPPAAPRTVQTGSDSVAHPLPPMPQDLSLSYPWDESPFTQEHSYIPCYGLDSVPVSPGTTYPPTGSGIPPTAYTTPGFPTGIAGSWPSGPTSSSSNVSSPDAGPSSSSMAPRYSPAPQLPNNLLLAPVEYNFDFTQPLDSPAYPSAPTLLQIQAQNTAESDAVQPRPAKRRRSLPLVPAGSSSKASSSCGRSNKTEQFVRRRRSEALAAKIGTPVTSRKRKHREENDENEPPVSHGQQADEGELVLWDLFRKKEVQLDRKLHCRFRAQGCRWTFDGVRDLKRHEEDRSHRDDRKAMGCTPLLLYHCPWTDCDFSSRRDYCLKSHWKALTRGCVKHLIEDPRWPYESLEDLHQHLREHPAYFQCPEF
ncbi:uncharacterized protein LAESUDRAFT_491531 [Laetiporus sulphureus 93-53]|uniref:Uncharacterized protein n=1 Tax=Laetiporus sulphureus 93-53 TaxID=1314785 RepID=A0A165BL11_9APHY|nr:uncharacterized protein LAESUDRAFT_491531 [Laetiporus sulphureus 93-53]KZT01248.1 hypothetical protein LAESUDRAFT_491531 [Laetiporus sulphureus 93-53]